MKFTLKCGVTPTRRRGVISNVERMPEFTMETPNLLLYSQSGQVPHITPDVLQLLHPKPEAIMLPLPSIAMLQDRMKSAPMSIAQYIAHPKLLNIVTVMDPGRARLEGFHKTNLLAVQSSAGKKEFSPDSYMEFISNLKPDAFIALCDGDTSKDSSNKRVDKSMSRSQIMLKQCVANMKENGLANKCGLLVALEGGMDTRNRKKYAAEVSEYKDAVGVVIDGLGQFGEEVSKRDVKDYVGCINASLEECQIEGLRLLPGAWHPSVIFDLIDLGVDLFDTSYCTIVTDRGGALQLPLHDHLIPSKRDKPPSYELSLKDPINAECFEPVLASCECHCCKNHTRAYIHHLLNVNEMLASVLLNIHNHQQYLELFAVIRHSIDNNTFQQLRENFLR